MLVEDDNNLREIYGERLMAEGYDIVSANDGEEALALAVKEKPDLILSDVMMPKISGFDMLDILRQTPETKNTKVVMMTALSQTEDKDRAERLGADKYLVKSQVTLEDVARVVHDLLYGESEPTLDKSVEDTTSVETPPAPEQVQPPAEPVAPASVPTAEPSTSQSNPVSPEPVVDDQQTPAPVAVEPALAPIADNSSMPISSPVAATEPAKDNANEPQPVNPITGEAANQELTQTNSTSSASAKSTEEEVQEFNSDVSNFDKIAPQVTATDHSEPLVEPTEQDVIHAKNAADEPTVTKSEFGQEATETAKPTIDISDGAPSHQKVIQPIADELPGAKDINALYEQEMRQEAADTPISNPGAGAILDPDNSANNPIAGDKEEVEPLEKIDASQIPGITFDENPPKPLEDPAPDDTDKQPDVNDPGHIAL